MRFLSDSIASFEKKLAIVLMFAMAVIVAAAVIFRYVLNIPLVWASEVSIFLLIYITFIGGSLGLKYKTQASVTLLTDKLPGKFNTVVSVLGHIFMLLFMAILLFYCFKWITSPSVAIQKSSSMLMPMWIAYMVLPVGLLFATVHLLNNLLTLVKGSETK